MDLTTIKLSKSTLEFLNKFKVHPRQPYDEIISLLLKHKEKMRFADLGGVPKQATTIKVSKSNVSGLSKLKLHPRQPYDEVVMALIKGLKK